MVQSKAKALNLRRKSAIKLGVGIDTGPGEDNSAMKSIADTVSFSNLSTRKVIMPYPPHFATIHIASVTNQPSSCEAYLPSVLLKLEDFLSGR